GLHATVDAQEHGVATSYRPGRGDLIAGKRPRVFECVVARWRESTAAGSGAAREGEGDGGEHAADRNQSKQPSIHRVLLFRGPAGSKPSARSPNADPARVVTACFLVTPGRDSARDRMPP